MKLAFLFLLIAFAPALSAAANWETKTNCDIPSASLRETKTATLEECQKLCDETTECKAVVHISGWKKCALKTQGKKTSQLKFISGELDESHVYTKDSFKEENDHTGKDLKREVLDDANACGDACAKNAECKAFTYLDGYRVCWLKKGGGKFNPKIFSCSVKS